MPQDNHDYAIHLSAETRIMSARPRSQNWMSGHQGWRLLCLGFLLSVLSAPALAVDSEFRVLLDLDNDAGTGCTVMTVDGPFDGVEQMLITGVATDASGSNVTGASRRECVDPSTDAFGTPISVQAGPWPVGLGNGPAGEDVIETVFPKDQLTHPTIRVGFMSSENALGNEDALLSTGGGPIIITDVIQIPTLSALGLGLAMLLLLGAAVLLRRHPGVAGGALAVVLLVGGIGVAVAAIVLDGQIDDWSGIAPLATDPPGDGLNADILTVYASPEAGGLYFRIDADMNQAPTAVDDGPYAVDEDTVLNVPVATGVLANDTDPDAGTSLTAVLGVTTANGALTLNPDGSFDYTPGADFNGTDSFTYRANDGQLDSTDATVTIQVAPVNDPPTFVKGPDVTVPEDSGAQTISPWATGISPGPANESGQTVSFNIAANDNPGLFAAGPTVVTDGSLSFTSAPNASGVANITLVATDDGGTANGGVDTSAAQSFIITVSAVNDPPIVTTTGGATAFTEDGGPLVVDAGVTVTDADNATLASATVTIANSQDGAAEVLAASACAALTVTPGLNSLSITGSQPPAVYQACLQSVTYDNTSQNPNVTPRQLDFVANDGTDPSATASKTMTVTPVNDAPVVTTSAGPTAFIEDAGPVAVDAGVTVIDVDNASLASASVTITNLQDTGQEILVADTTGTAITASYVAPVLTLSGSDTPANYQQVLRTVTYGNGSQSPDATPRQIDFLANDGALDSAIASKTVTVTSVNDLPVVTTSAGSAAFIEDGGPVALDAAVTVTDADDVNLASATVTITNLLDSGKEVLAATTGGTAITANYVAPTLTLSGSDTLANYQQVLRTVTYDNSSQNPDPTDRQIDFVANDGTDPSATTSKTVTVAPVNDAPSFTKGPDQTSPQDVGAQTVSPWATAILAGPPDESGQTVTFNITGNTNVALFSAGPAVSSTGVLTYTSAPGVYGNATITLEAMDDGGTANGGVDTSASQSFVITVTQVNQPPSFTKGPDETVLEDAGAQTVNPWATTISPGPAGESGQTVSFNITNNTNAALFSAGPAVSSSGGLTYTPAANANGSATITLVAMDDGGTAGGGMDTSAPQSFVINVTPVNDAPSFAKGLDSTVNEDAGPQAVNPWATAISTGPANESGQTLTFNITANTNPGLFSAGPAVDSSGVLTYTPAANANGMASITLEAMDNGGTGNGGVDTSATQTFTITVNAVNDPPVAQNKTGFAAQANMKILGLGDSATLLAGVTDADTGVSGCMPTFSVASITSSSGGTVSNVNLGAGTFDFDPAPGFTGNAIVQYTVADDGCPGSATSAPANITINVSGPVIWFVDPGPGTNGTGTLSSSFSSLASANTAKGASVNHRVFVYTGMTGAGVGVTLAGGATQPMAQWLIGQGATGSNFDSLMGIAPPSGTIPRPSIGGTRPTIQGTLTLNGNNVRAQGFNLVTGTLTGINDAVGAVSGVSVSEASVTSTTGTAVALSNLDGTISLTSVSANGGTAPGIDLDTTGGSFAVTGSGAGDCKNDAAQCSGGTIANRAGAGDGADGILLNAAANVSLAYMQVDNNNRNGIFGTAVNGFVFNQLRITNNADQASPDEAGILMMNSAGMATISNTLVQNSYEHDVVIRNTSGTLTNLAVSNSTFSNDGASGSAANQFFVDTGGTGNVTVNMSACTIVGGGGTLTAFGAVGDVAAGSLSFVSSTGTVTNANVGLSASASSAGALIFGFQNNIPITGSRSYAINDFANASHTSTIDGREEGNTVGTFGTLASGSQTGSGSRVSNEGGGTATVLIDGNTIQEVGNGSFAGFEGIYVNKAVTSGTTNVTITDNMLDQIRDDRGLNAQIIFAGTQCANISGNTFTNIGGSDDLRVRQTAGTFNVTQTSVANLSAVNNGATATAAGTISYGQPACPTPP